MRKDILSTSIRKYAELYHPRPAGCEACGARTSLQLDHDHDTGLFRGWLCGSCNRALGHAQDDAGRLRLLADYIEGRQ